MTAHRTAHCRHDDVSGFRLTNTDMGLDARLRPRIQAIGFHPPTARYVLLGFRLLYYYHHDEHARPDWIYSPPSPPYGYPRTRLYGIPRMVVSSDMGTPYRPQITMILTNYGDPPEKGPLILGIPERAAVTTTASEKRAKP